MKKLILVLLLFVLGTTFSEAQFFGSRHRRSRFYRPTMRSQNFDFNQVNVFVNKSNLTPEDIGFGLAIYEVVSRRRHSMRFGGIEYVYSKEKNDFLVEDNNKIAYENASYEFHNLLIPFGFRWHLGRRTKLFVSGSMALDFALYSRIDAKKINNFDEYSDQDYEEDFEMVDYSISVPFMALAFTWGAGFSIPVRRQEELVFELTRFISLRNNAKAHYDAVRINQLRYVVGYRWKF